MNHTLAIWDNYFTAITDGRKLFEIRKKTERTFKVGDLLTLKETDPSTLEFTGREVVVEITYVLDGSVSPYPELKDLVIMSIVLLKENNL